jgi:hypothetical protein
LLDFNSKYAQANNVCIQCHSQGQPLQNPVQGKYYDWPVGFHVGLDLQNFWKLEEHKLGETSFRRFADGTAHKNRMQGNDFVTSLMYTHGVTCFISVLIIVILFLASAPKRPRPLRRAINEKTLPPFAFLQRTRLVPGVKGKVNAMRGEETIEPRIRRP